MGPRILVLFGLVGALACKRQPELEPASEPTVFAELPPGESANHSPTAIALCDHISAIMADA